MQQVDGLIYIVSAPSGAGKTSLVKALLEQDTHLEVSVSHTTRAARTGEIDGKDYHFVGDKAFSDMVEQGEFVEHAQVFDHHYGTSFKAIDTITSQGKHIVLDIDWQGARQIKQQFPDNSIGIFLLPPSIGALRARLEKRGQDAPETIVARMARAQSEMGHYSEADYVIINDDFEQALSDLKAIVRTGALQVIYQQYHHPDVFMRLLQSGR